MGTGVAVKQWRSPKKTTHVCTQCGSEIRAAKITPGSFGMELLLWLFFLVPGVIYSIWRIAARYTGCPVCDSRNIVPLGTPMANRVLASFAEAARNTAAKPAATI